MKSIIFISSNFKPGGVQNVLSNLSEPLGKEYNLSILLDNRKDIFYEFKGNILSLEVDDPKDYNNLIYQLHVLVKRFFFLCRHRKEYDYIVSVKDSAHLPNILTKRKGGKTIIAIYCNVDSMSKVTWTYRVFVKPIIKSVYKMSDAIFVTSEGVRNQLAKYGIANNKMKVIFDGVNIECIERLAQEHMDETEQRIFNNRPVICALGRLDPVKGYDHLIRVIKNISNDLPDILLIIMGEGKIRHELETMVREMNLENNVKLMGFIENPYKYISNSRIFVMSSLAEGFPTVLMEAMVCETPIISTDMESGAREILAPNTDINYINTDTIEYAEYGVLVPVFRKNEDGRSCTSASELVMARAIKDLLYNKTKIDEYKNRYKDHKAELSHRLCANKWKRYLNETQNNT